MKKFAKITMIITLAIALCLSVIGLTACQDPAPQEKTYTVTFQSNGGTAYLPATVGEGGVNLPEPQREGYVFDGWYLSADFSGKIIAKPYVPESNVTVYAKWTAIEGKITFVSNGGTEYEPITFSAQSVNLPTPTRTDYEFLGWYTSEDFSGDPLGASYFQAGEVTVYAKWEYKVDFVTFNSNGGTEVESIRAEGQTIDELAEPSRYGYEFLGWFTAETEETPVQLPLVADKSISLVAKWKQVTYVYLYYGTSTDYQRIVGEPGDVLDTTEFFTPDALVVEHYLENFNCPFDGWVYENPDSYDGIGEPVGESITLGDDHVILIATYDKSNVLPLSNVTKNQDGSLTTTARIAMVTKRSDTMLGKYSFDATFAKGAGGSDNIAFRMNMSGVDYAYESGQAYLAAGVLPSNGSMQISSVLGSWSHLTGKAYSLATLPQAWQDKFNGAGAGELITVNLMVENFADHFNFYIDGDFAFTYGLGEGESQKLAQFTGTDFGIRCSTTGATFGNFEFTPIANYTLKDGETTVHTGVYVQGDAISQTVQNKAITNDGQGNYSYQKFVGWANTPDGELTTTFGESTTLHAKFESVTVYRVTLDSDNGDDVVEQFYHANETIELPANPEKNGTTSGGTATGYAFDKWVIDGTDTQVTNQTAVTANMDIVATYTTSTAYVVSYVTNMDGVTIEDSVVASGETFTLPSPTKQGYRLDGWYTNEGLTDKYLSAPVTSAFTLYAKWVETVDVTFTCGGAEIDVVTIDKGATATLPADQTKANVTHDNGNISSFAFDGWFVGGGVQVTADTTFDTDTTVTGTFTESVTRNGYAVTQDANGDVYTFANSTSKQGFTIPDLTVSNGEVSFDVTIAQKPTAELNFRIGFWTDDAGVISFTGNGSQKGAWVNINFASGRLILGSKILGKSENVYELGLTSVKDCAYKTNYNAWTTTTSITLKIKVIFADSTVKYYIDDCLLIAFGDNSLYNSAEGTFDGETLYGMYCDPATKITTNNVGNFIQGTPLITGNGAGQVVPKGNQLALIMWNNLGTNSVAISNIKSVQYVEATYVNGDETVATQKVAPNSAVTKTLPNGEIVDDGGNYSYQKFVGWYDAQTGGNKVETITSDCTLYARFESVTVYKVTIDADNGSEVSTSYYHANETITLPANPAKDGESVNGSLVGYTFDKWLCGDVQVTAETVVNANMTIVASYTVSKAHTVTYVTNKDGLTIDSDTLADGTTLVLPTNPTYEGYDFDGWYTDETLQTPYVVGAVTSSFTLYAKWTNAIQVTFDVQGGNDVESLYIYKTDKSVTLPIATTSIANRIFNGWFVDADCKNAVDVSTITSSLTLYAGWRYPLANVTESQGVYNVTAKTIAVFGETSYDYTEIVMDISFTKGQSGGTGIAFRMNVFADNSYEKVNGENYLAAVFVPNGGTLQVCSVKDGTFAHLTGSVVKLANLPQAWQDKYNNTASNSTINAQLSVRDYGDRFEVYIDGDLAYTYNDATNLANFTGVGYGIRSSSTNVQFSNVQIAQIYQVTYVNGGETVATEYLPSGASITKTLSDGDVTDDGEGNFSYQKFVGWYDAQTGGNKVETITSDCTLYARFETTAVETPPVEITFVSDGQTVDAQSVASGTSAQLPTDPTKANVTAENGNVSSFAFVGWFVGETQVTADTTFDADTTVTAKFTETVKRNGAVVSSDENGTTYSFTSCNDNFIGAVADQDLSLSSGELSCTVTASKVGTDCGQIRINVLVNDNGDVVSDGSAEEGLIFVNINLTSGGLTLGSKVNNASKNAISATFGNINSCAYKTNYTAAKNDGTAYTFNVTMQFGADWLKVYVDGCLMFVIGTTTTETVYVKDTVTPNTTNLAQLEAYLAGTGAVTTGDKVGFWVYGQTAGTITVSNIKVTPATAEAQDLSVKSAPQQAIVPTSNKEN